MNNLTINTNSEEILLSKIILGTTSFGTDICEDTSISLLELYTALGGRTIDTASIYGDWEDAGIPVSEITIGKWLKNTPYRNEVKIITKGCHHRLKTPEISRVNSKAIREDVEKSLNALQIDNIDLYFLHRDNPKLPVDELMETLADLVRQKKIKAIGASNWSTNRIVEANEYAKLHKLPGFSVSEIQWSLAQITPEFDDFPNLPHMTWEEYNTYLQLGIPVLAWSSQAGGIITKLLSGQTVKSKKYQNAETYKRAEKVGLLSKETGYSPTQITIAYLTSNPLPASTIIGCSNVKQLKDSMTAQYIQLTKEEIDYLDSDRSL